MVEGLPSAPLPPPYPGYVPALGHPYPTNSITPATPEADVVPLPGSNYLQLSPGEMMEVPPAYPGYSFPVEYNPSSTPLTI